MAALAVHARAFVALRPRLRPRLPLVVHRSGHVMGRGMATTTHITAMAGGPGGGGGESGSLPATSATSALPHDLQSPKGIFVYSTTGCKVGETAPHAHHSLPPPSCSAPPSTIPPFHHRHPHHPPPLPPPEVLPPSEAYSGGDGV